MFTSVLRARILPMQKQIIYSVYQSLLLTKSDVKFCKTQSVRTLFSMNSLGLEGFLKQGARSRGEDLDKTSETHFVQKMEKILKSSDEKNIIYTEDLKKLVAYCQENKEYFNLVLDLAKKHNDQIQGLNLKPYMFGPVIIRLLYLQKCPDEALELLLKDDCAMFHQASSYQLAMNLLYEQGRHEDVLQLMDNILNRNLFPLPNSCVTLALASNYKLSTESSLKHSIKLIRKAAEQQGRLSFKSIAFASKLALDIDKIEVGLEFISHSRSIKHFLINNIHILAKLRLGCLDEVLQILRTRTLIDSPKTSSTPVKHVFAFDVIDEIEKIVNDKLEAELTSDFNHLKNILKDMNLISTMSLDESVLSPIEDYFLENGRDNMRSNNFRPYKPSESYVG